ncbi:MAG: MlaD family protein [Actinomycetota bacterium]
MRRRGRTTVAANSVLIGAATTLVLIVAVFLAYNANDGLPFVPSYEINVQVPNADNLVKGNDVRIAGTRVGLVSAISPVSHPDGSTTAVLRLKLKTSVDPLPKDSTVWIRPISALGLKYVQITKGTDPQGFASGATMPLANATPIPVEIDEIFNMFDTKTRVNVRLNTDAFGNSLAGRGSDLNETIGNLPALLRNLEPVMRNLASDETRLDQFFYQLGRTAAIVAPVAQQQAALFSNLDTTFAALATVARPFIQESISGGPASLEAAIETFPVIRPFLANTEALFTELQPTAVNLNASAEVLADATTAAIPALLKAPAFDARLVAVGNTLKVWSNDPVVAIGLDDLTETFTQLNPTISALAPTQVTCNYLALFFRNAASLLSEGDSKGTFQRFIIIPTPTGKNNEGSPSSAPANGPEVKNHLHANPYPNTAAPGQPKECEAANETYAIGKTVLTNPSGNQGTNTDWSK